MPEVSGGNGGQQLPRRKRLVMSGKKPKPSPVERLVGFLGKERTDKPTDHHIIPRSRGGKGGPENICIVPCGKHEAYHYMFRNMTPDEILEELVVNYWNGQWHWLLRALPK